MSTTPFCSIFVAIADSSGAWNLTAGKLLLGMAGNSGRSGIKSRSFGPRIRGNAAAYDPHQSGHGVSR